MRSKICMAALCGFVLVGILSVEAKPKHKIGMARATAIAKQHAHGTLKSKELEKEKGRWIYSFEFRAGGGKIREVNIDAYTGKVVGIEHEDERKEAQEEKKAPKSKN